jgi:hypothetical protein
MKNKVTLTVALLFFIGTLLPLHGQGNITVKEDVFVAKDEVQENVITFGGNVTVEGRIKQNIAAFGGTIILSGEVDDSVVGFGSAITLRSTAVVKGDVVSLGGVLQKYLS